MKDLYKLHHTISGRVKADLESHLRSHLISEANQGWTWLVPGREKVI